MAIVSTPASRRIALAAVSFVALCAGSCTIGAQSVFSAEQPEGAEIYAQRCAACHNSSAGRVPPLSTIRDMSPEGIVTALTNGPMVFQAAGMSRDEMNAVAKFLSNKPFGAPQVAPTRPHPCARPAAALRLNSLHPKDEWNGWGKDLENSRFQADPGIKASDVPRLKIKWAYAYAGRFAYGQPTIVADRLFVTNTLGEVRALDAGSGCEYWAFKADASVKVAIAVGSVQIANRNVTAAFFGDEKATAYAVDADTGALLWKTNIEKNPVARIVGAPVFHSGRVYVPVSSAEEGAARDPNYECCTFRGSVSALSAIDGAVLWKTYTIAAEPKPMKISSAGTQMYGPAGGAIWSAPTIDARRNLIYVATGNSYTDAPSEGSDAVVAFDLDSGVRKWVNQLTEGDNFVVGCPKENAGVANCPEDGGPDFDFGSSPILRNVSGGRQIIIAAQKSGIVYGLDPDADGKLLWQTRVGHGAALGGVEWGPAADKDHVYVAVSDAVVREGAMPGLTALKITDGSQRWHVPTPAVKCAWGEEQCRRGQPGAVTVIPGIVFSGALDGHLRAYDAGSGAVVWDFDTAAAVATVNGPATSGGSIDAGGATIANGVLYVNSGYGRWGKPGRLLLAFSVDGK